MALRREGIRRAAGAVAALVFGVSLASGCGFAGAGGEPDDDDDDAGSSDAPFDNSIDAASADAAPVPTEFPIDRLLEDEDILGGAAISVADVQAFLESEGSFLATYTDPSWGQSAAALVVSQSQARGISPLYMLARIQTESSLVSSGTSSHLEAATGCGCPDQSGCDPALAGFGNQVECSATKMASYYADLDAGQPTIAGWQAGVAKSTLDPCEVTPANKATAALFTYTPWAGAYAIECGRDDVGGSSLVALVYHRFKAARAWPGL